MEKFAQAIKEAVKIRDESWNEEAYKKAFAKEKEAATERGKDGEIKYNPFYVDTEDFYSVSLRNACEIAAQRTGLGKRGTEPLYFLLQKSWHNSLNWANNPDVKK